MSLLLELKSRVEKLPQLQKQKKNNQKVSSFSVKIDEALKELKDCIDQRRCFLVVFPDANLNKTIDAVKQSKENAAWLMEKLQADFDEISSVETNSKVTNIRTMNGDAKRQILKEWKGCVEEELKYFTTFEEIVRSLPGYESIIESFSSIQSRTSSPPVTLSAAIKLKEDLTLLRSSLGKLQLDGAGGQFLKMAVNGRASAKDLLDTNVQQFLEKYSLWDILTIKVGK